MQHPSTHTVPTMSSLELVDIIKSGSGEGLIAALDAVCRTVRYADIDALKLLYTTLDSYTGDYKHLVHLVQHNVLCWESERYVQPKTKEPGVYVAEFGEGVVKIGRTNFWSERLADISTMGAEPLSRWAFAPVAHHSVTEAHLHRKFSDSRTNGEFFKVGFEEAVTALREAPGVRDLTAS